MTFMLQQLRHTIIKNIWEQYRQHSTEVQQIENALKKKGINLFPLDHFAIIDLPSSNTGIPQLLELFTLLGFSLRGQDYLADKQNDFAWLAESDYAGKAAHEVLPQVVVADFRLEELPVDVRGIIEKYGQQSPGFCLDRIKELINQAKNHDIQAAHLLNELILNYLSGRDWPLPTVDEFYTVQSFNELLAWVLVFGRKPNHFTLSVHLLNHFPDLEHFHQFIEQEVGLKLNQDGGIIKGSKVTGIAQGSTMGVARKIKLADGEIELPTDFIEFVWRYPLHTDHPSSSLRWDEYFTNFIAQHADHVIESLYT